MEQTAGHSPPVIAITGGLGSGKSTAAKIFSELGASIISADELARSVVVPPSPALSRIVERFGTAILQPDGTLNRSKLGGLVFSDATARRDLEFILHPAIRSQFREELLRRRRAGVTSPIMYEAPVLFEAGPLPPEISAVLLIAAPEATCIQRAVARGMPETDARARLAAQLPLDEKRKLADFVIENDSDIESLRTRIVEFYKQFTQGG